MRSISLMSLQIMSIDVPVLASQEFTDCAIFMSPMMNALSKSSKSVLNIPAIFSLRCLIFPSVMKNTCILSPVDKFIRFAMRLDIMILLSVTSYLPDIMELERNFPS